MSQVIQLHGVVDNGSRYLPTVSTNTAREIQFPRLGDVTLDVCATYPNGLFVLAGTDLTFTLRTSLDPSCPGTLLKKTGTFTNGRGTISIASADTARFCPSRLVWDIWLTVAGSKYQIVSTSICRLQPNVTVAP